MKYWEVLETDLVPFTLVCGENALLGLYFGEHEPEGALRKKTKLMEEASKQLKEYFSGERQVFDLPLCPEGTPFQKKVWEALKTIPYGETRTYQEIAVQIGNPKACRAVGGANNKNPISIIIPCHRVIGAGGSLVGYGGGLSLKEKLLRLENS